MPKHQESAQTPGVEIKISDLKQPPIVGFADQCWVGIRGTFVEILFFEQRTEGVHVVARFVIGKDDLVREMWPRTKPFFEALREMAEKVALSPSPLSATSPDPGHTAAVACNVVGISRSGLDGQIDGYYATPRSIAFARQSLRNKPKVEILPLLSVQLPTPLLLSLLGQISEMMASLEADVEQLKGFL